MLSALLPGVREFRTPLVTGLLWAACAWLLFGSAVVGSASTKDFVAGLGVGKMPASTWIGASALLTYLVGSLLIVRTSPFGSWGERVLEWLRSKVDRLDVPTLPVHMRYRPIWRLWQTSPNLLTRTIRGWIQGDGMPPEIDGWLRNEFQSEMEKGRAPVMRSFLGGCMTPVGFEGFCASDSISGEGRTPSMYEGHDTVDMLAHAFVAEVVRERSAVETRIQMRHPELYAEIDRLNVEGEFRLSIFWPLTLLILLLGWSWSPLALVLLALPPLLARDGHRRIAESADKTWGALMAKEVTSPTLDAMEAARASKTAAFDFSERYPGLGPGHHEDDEDNEPIAS